MHLLRSVFVVALVTPLTLAGPRENPLHRRIGNDDKDKYSSTSAVLLPTGHPPSATLSSFSMPASFSYGTAVFPAPESTVAILTTEVVYTTLTTCPITSTVTSGTRSFEEVTTTISTVTRTSISTICFECVAPPKTKTDFSATPVQETALSTVSPSIKYSLTQPSAGLTYVSSKPETHGTGATASPSKGLSLLSRVSLTVSAALSTSASAGLSGYAIVPSPSSKSGDKGPLSNATASITPVFTPSLIGNGYGGGLVSTPSVYVVKLPFPNGPSEGVPPGYGFSSQPGTLPGTSSSSQPSSTSNENSPSLFTGLGLPSSTNFTVFTGLGLPSSTAFHVGNVTYQVSLPAATASLLSSIVPILNAPSISATTYTSQLGAPSGSLFTASAVIVGGSGFGFAVMGPQGSSNGSIGVKGSTAAITTDYAVPGIGTQSEIPQSTPAIEMPISMGANGSPIFAHASSEILSNVPAVVLTHTATSGEVIVGTSNPPAVFISTVGSNQELTVTTSTPSPVLVSQTASSGQVFLQTSTPLAIFVTPASVTETSLVIGSPIAIGVLGSPTSSSAQDVAAPITLAATSSPQVQGVASGSSTATVLAPTVGANGLTSSFVNSSPYEQISTAGQPFATTLTPVVGANGLTSLAVAASSAGQPATAALTSIVGANSLTSLAVVPTPTEQTPSANQPAATVITPVTGFNGLTSLAVIPSPVVGANGLTSLAVFSTPVAAANGLSSPAVILTPVIGANGQTSLAVLATPVVGANGLTSLAIGLQGQQGSSGTPSPIVETIAAPITTSPPVFGPGPMLGSFSPSIYSTLSPGGDSNSSVHIILNPSIVPFEGSAFKLSLSIGMGLLSFILLVLFL